MAIHVALIVLSNYLAFLLRFIGVIPVEDQQMWRQTIPWLVLIRGVTFIPFRLFQGSWPHNVSWDLRNILGGVLTSTILFFLSVQWGFGLSAYPRSVFVIDSLLLIFLLAAVKSLAAKQVFPRISVILWNLLALRFLLLLGLLYQMQWDYLENLAFLGAIYFISTFFERAILFLLISLTLTAGSCFLVRSVDSKPLKWSLSFLLSFLLFWLLLHFLSEDYGIATALLITGLLGLNEILDKSFVRAVTNKSKPTMSWIQYITVVVVSEVLMLKAFFACLLKESNGWTSGRNRQWQVGRLFPIALLVPAIAISLLSTKKLAELRRRVFPDSAVRQIANDSVYTLAYDDGKQLLYVSGQGLPAIQVYDTNNLSVPPRVSPVYNENAQAFFYNSADNEIYVYKLRARQLLVLDASTLELKKLILTPRVSPGDTFVVWDKFSDNIVVASEANIQRDFPTIVVNRSTGQLVDTLGLEIGHILVHPTKPYVYINFFRRSDKVMIYDTEQRKIVRQITARSELDRMALAFSNNKLELLIASPLDSAVLRFDAESLHQTGMIKTVFGVRALAVDPVRNLLLCGSLVNNLMEVIDLETQRSVAKYHVCPWLRDITVNSKAGVAYVSSRYGLFSVQYTSRIPSAINNRVASVFNPRK